MHPAENNHAGLGLGRLLGQSEGVSDEIRHVLNLRDLVIMGQDHGIEFPLQGEDLLRQRVESFRRHGLADAVVEPDRSGGAGLSLSSIVHGRKIGGRPGESMHASGWRSFVKSPGVRVESSP